MVVSKTGKRKQKLQLYRCESGHQFRVNNCSQWNDSFIEYVVYVYLRCLSLNTTVDLVRATYEEDLLTKKLILQFIEQVADGLPTLDDIDRLYEPVRSGYLAFDGLWFSFRGEDIVLLVCFDPETFDLVSAIWRDGENRAGYEELIKKVLAKIDKDNIKGIYGDGDNGLLLASKDLLGEVPFQLCIVHKELRMGQIVPVKIVRRSKKMEEKVKKEILEFQRLFREVIYAHNKQESKDNLKKLKKFSNQSSQERLRKAYRSLKHRFPLTLTHFDHPGMMRDNNLIECFNGCLRPRLDLMKGFKKWENLDRYLKLFLLEFRFHSLKESRFKNRRGKSPLELGGVYLDKSYNFISFLRKALKLSFQPPAR